MRETKTHHQPTVSAWQVIKSYWAVLRSFRWALAVILAADIIAGVLELLVPIYYKRFFDALVSTADKAVLAPQLLYYIYLILGIQIVGWTLWRIILYISNYFESAVLARLKQQAFEYMIDHSYRFFANNFTGSLVQRVNRYSRSFERLADQITFSVIPLFIKIVGVIVVLVYIQPYIAKVLAVLVVTYLTFNFFFSRWKIKYDIARAAADSRTTGVLSDAITNHTTIQLFTGKDVEAENFQRVSNDQARIMRFTWNLNALVESAQAAFMVIAEFLLFYYAISYWQAGIITVGSFVLIQVYLIGLGGRLWNFSRIIRDFYESMADAKEMVEILDMPHEIRDAHDAGLLDVHKGNIEFKDVEFQFNDNREVLKKMNLTIAGGERLALVGPSGAGKTTLVRLLLRVYDVQGGEISIDGQNIQRVTQKSLREKISLVPQDPILFHRSLMENIRYGRRSATDEEVVRAARLAHCHEFISELPHGYDTYVGERGVKLSGGERQRVAIARAILRSAPILVLDEATSSLDSHSEALIQDALKNLMHGKTTIAIAHRLSTIRQMDRIIVIDGGNIIQEGSHDELSNREGSLYHTLWTLQAGGFLIDSDDNKDEKN